MNNLIVRQTNEEIERLKDKFNTTQFIYMIHEMNQQMNNFTVR